MGSHDEEICAALARLALAGDGVVLGLGMATLAVRTWFKFRYNAKALKQVEDTPEVPIHDLLGLVQHDGFLDDAKGNSSTKLASNHHRELHEPLVIVRGKVATEARGGEVLVVQNAPELAVFIERTQTYLYNEWRGLFGWRSEWRGLLGWGCLKEQVSVSRRKIPFVLLENEPQHEDAHVHISMDDLRHPLPLVTVYHQLHPVQTSSYALLQAVFGRRYPVGVLDEEKILALGREITAVGSLAKTPEGHLVIKPCSHLPCFLTEYKREQLVTEIGTRTNVLFWSGIVLGSLAAGILASAICKNWCRWKEWRRRRQRLDEAAREDQQLADGEEQEHGAEVPEGELCVVCLLRRRRAAFVSCGHRVCCMVCARRVEHHSLNAKCPVCRESVTGVIRIYDA